jgi:hypothetical protein
MLLPESDFAAVPGRLECMSAGAVDGRIELIVLSKR